MKLVATALLLTLSFVLTAYSSDPLPTTIARGLKDAKEKFTSESEEAKLDLLAAFTEATDRLRDTPRITDAELAAGIETISAEKERFEKTGRIPFSQPMRAATITYLKRTNSAHTLLTKWYDKAAAHHLRSKNDTAALAVKAEKEKVIDARIVGTIQRLDHPFKWALRSDATADGSRTWSLDTKYLVVKFHDPARPTVWTHTCLVHPDGQHFDCIDQSGGKFRAKLID